MSVTLAHKDKISFLYGKQTSRVITFVGFEVLTAVAMKSSVFWDIAPCSSVKVNRRFGYGLNLQVRRISQVRNQHEAGSKEGSGLFLGLLFDPDDGGDMSLRNVRFSLSN
jgi:hypothetical protein